MSKATTNKTARGSAVAATTRSKTRSSVINDERSLFCYEELPKLSDGFFGPNERPDFSLFWSPSCSQEATATFLQQQQDHLGSKQALAAAASTTTTTQQQPGTKKRRGVVSGPHQEQQQHKKYRGMETMGKGTETHSTRLDRPQTTQEKRQEKQKKRQIQQQQKLQRAMEDSTLQEQEQPQQAAVDNPEQAQLSDAEFSRHVMYDWSEWCLGETTGTGAWNSALRARLIRSGEAGPVPQLSSVECLFRLQHEEGLQHLPTIVPPPNNGFWNGATSEKNSPKNKNEHKNTVQPNTKDDGEKQGGKEVSMGKVAIDIDFDSDARLPAQEKQTGVTPAAPCAAAVPSVSEKAKTMMQALYQLMITQDMDNGSAIRRDLRLTSAMELGQRMQRAETTLNDLSTREMALRKHLFMEQPQLPKQGGDSNASALLSLEVARMRGMA